MRVIVRDAEYFTTRRNPLAKNKILVMSKDKRRNYDTKDSIIMLLYR